MRPLDARTAQKWAEWLSTRPLSIQLLAAEFPPETTIEINTVTYYCMGWTEDDMVMFTPTDPNIDYERAVAERVNICVQHLRRMKMPEPTREQMKEANELILQLRFAIMRYQNFLPEAPTHANEAVAKYNAYSQKYMLTRVLKRGDTREG